MFCPRCGTKNVENARFCAYCGDPITAAVPLEYAPRQFVPNYLVQAVLVALFCCLPFGIVAIVYAAQVDSLAAAGKAAEAQQTSAKARTWCWVSLICGILPFGLGILYTFARATVHTIR